MKVIYKQELRLGCGEQILRFASLYTVLRIEMQAGVPCIWFLCDPEGPATDAVFTTLGTGHMSSDNWFEENYYIGSYQTLDDSDRIFVGHVFMREE